MWHLRYSLVAKCFPHTSHRNRRSPEGAGTARWQLSQRNSVLQSLSKNHRIRAGKDLRGHRVQPVPDPHLGHQCHVQVFPERIQGQGFHPVPMPDNPSHKRILPDGLNLPWHHLRPFLRILSLVPWEQSPNSLWLPSGNCGEQPSPSGASFSPG